MIIPQAMATTRPNATVAAFMFTAPPVLLMKGLLLLLLAVLVELVAVAVELEVLPLVRERDPPQASFQLSMAELASIETVGSAATRQFMHVWSWVPMDDTQMQDRVLPQSLIVLMTWHVVWHWEGRSVVLTWRTARALGEM